MWINTPPPLLPPQVPSAIHGEAIFKIPLDVAFFFKIFKLI